MAPTETLAEQHFLTIERTCAELGVRVALLTSSLTARERRAVAPARRLGRRRHRRRHARAHPARRRVRRPRRRRRRRAAPLRRRAARRARGGAEPARPAHDGDADPAHARAHGLRRPRRLRDLRAAGEPQADRDGVGHRGAQLRGVHAAPRHLDDGRQAYVVCPLVEGSRDHASRARPRTRRSGCGRTSCAGYRVGCVHGRLQDGRPPRGDGGVHRRRARRPRRDDGHRGRRRRPERDDHDRPGGRPLRPGAAPPAPRPRRSRRGAVVLPARLAPPATSSRRAAIERLEAMVATTDGFELAERDLEIRGEGQLVGARQSGLTDLRFTRLRADRDLLERAKELADEGVGGGVPRGGRRARSSARPSTSASRDGRRTRVRSRDADHRGNAPRPADRRAEGRAHAADGRPGARGALQPRRPGRRRVRARPLRGLGRARPRGALARCPPLRVRRDRRGGVPRDPAEPRVARAHRSARAAARRRSPSCARSARPGDGTSSILLDPPYERWADARAGARRAPPGGRRGSGSSSSRRTRASSRRSLSTS